MYKILTRYVSSSQLYNFIYLNQRFKTSFFTKKRDKSKNKIDQIYNILCLERCNENRNVTLVWRRKSFMTFEFGRFLINKKIWLSDKTAL